MNEGDAQVNALLVRVRDAVRARPVSTPKAPSQLVARRIARDSRGLAEMFASRARSAGMRVTHVSESKLPETLCAILAEHSKIFVAVRDEAFHAIANAASRDRVVECRSADAIFDCEVGVTDVDCAIAESGSIVISTNGRIRNAWITPPTHIALVRVAQILPDLVDLFESRSDALDAASTTIITGPSKTADIEGVLVTGVHGPGVVEIVLID